MRTSAHLFLATFLAILPATASAQTTRYVDAVRCVDPGSGEHNDPFCTIQDGVDAALVWQR